MAKINITSSGSVSTSGIIFFLSIFFAQHLHSQIYINEILADNQGLNYDIEYQSYADWIELYNASDHWVDLSGWQLSDRETPTGTWIFPSHSWLGPREYLLIWADGKAAGLHASFSLNSDGESLFLFDTELNLIDKFDFPVQFENVSFGRSPDGSESIGYLSMPTPKAANPASFSQERSMELTFSHTGGFYENGLSLEISKSLPDGEIYYTIDGEDPRSGGDLYEGPISLDRTTVIRAAIRNDQGPDGPVYTHTFFINLAETGLPVISLTTPPANLWDDQMGIYVTGTNGIKGNGPSTDPPRNWNRDWERAAWFEVYDAQRHPAFEQMMGIKIFGGWSRSHDQKSLGVFPRKKYGKGSISYKLFEEKPIARFESIVLRNSGNDWATYGGTMLRDGFIHSLLAGQMDIDRQAYQPAVLYINGVYWGIQNMREKINEHYLTNNHAVNPDRLDLLAFSGDPIEGTNKAYKDMREFAVSNDMRKPENYQYVADRMDIQEYINYQITQIYIDNKDWPGNNIKFWKAHQAGSKWRWILYDTDFGWGMWNGSPDYNTLAFAREANGPGWPNPPWSTLLFRSLLKNPDFKQKFIQDFQAHIATTFKPARANRILDSLVLRIAPEMPTHFARWGGDMSRWNNAINWMKYYAEARPEFVISHLKSGFNLGNPVNLSIKKPDASKGIVKLQGVRLEEDVSSLFFPDYLIKIEAKAAEGYRFAHWKQSVPEQEVLVSAGASWKYLDTGVFPGSNWHSQSFDDSSWPSGEAQFGYGDGDENTVVNYGASSQNKHISTWFRKNISITDKDQYSTLQLRLKRDDGAVIYLNGQEVYRSNLPDGTITASTPALSGISGSDEESWVTASIHTQFLQEGDNTIAVEIHQVHGESSDISFDFELYALKDGNGFANIPDRVLSFIPDKATHLEAVFEVGNSPQSIFNLFINEWMAANQNHIRDEHNETADWIEIYNDNDFPVDIGGLYMSDDYNEPMKWRIPESDPAKTIIDAKGFLRLWADNSPEEGVLHLGFALRSEGEELILSEGGPYVLDSVSFGEMAPNTSRGRYPDGSQQWRDYIPGEATPAASNLSGRNLPPSFSSSPLLSAQILGQYRYRALATDPEGMPVSIKAVCLPHWIYVSDSGDGFIEMLGHPTPNEVGDWRVELLANDGLTGSDAVQSFVINLQHPIYQNGAQLVEKGQLYPNPSAGYFTYMRQVARGSEWQLDIFDMQGRPVISQQTTANSNMLRASFDLTQKSKGMFVLRVSGSGVESVYLKLRTY